MTINIIVNQPQHELGSFELQCIHVYRDYTTCYPYVCGISYADFRYMNSNLISSSHISQRSNKFWFDSE